jgi:hypothetical protein
MSSKRQQTMAKVARERTVKERRARKLEKKQMKKLAAAEGGAPMTDETSHPLPVDLNARYVDGGPPEPVAVPPTAATTATTDAPPVADPNVE